MTDIQITASIQFLKEWGAAFKSNSNDEKRKVELRQIDLKLAYVCGEAVYRPDERARLTTSYRNIRLSPKPQIQRPSPEALTLDDTMLVGNDAAGCGSVFAARSASVAITWVVPETGSKMINS